MSQSVAFSNENYISHESDIHDDKQQQISPPSPLSPASPTSTSSSTPRKSWIKFGGERNENGEEIESGESEARIEIDDGIANGSTSVATIEPSHSIQMTSSSTSEISTTVIGNDSQRQMRKSLPPSTLMIPPPPVINRATSQPPSSFPYDSNRQLQLSSSSTTSTTTSMMKSIPLKEISTTNISDQTNCRISTNAFINGDVIVTLLPLNKHCAWVTPASFKPELVPEELMSNSLTLTVEDYVNAMQILVNDFRFNLYVIFYKRILVIWIALGFIVLMGLLFGGVKGLWLFGLGVLWLILNALGIFGSMWLKLQLYHLLERCMANVNAILYKHNILVGIDDRGKISCHKVNLVFVYFDVTECIKYLKTMLEDEERARDTSQPRAQAILPPLMTSRMDIDTNDIIVMGSNPTRISQKEKHAEKLFLRYSQRWVKEFLRRRIDLHLPVHGDASIEPPANVSPRHCTSSRCPCQFIEEHLRFKPLTQCSISELFM